ncbi:MAG: hypothetical protein K0S88_3228 [Actinomycetia bacterium]|jgi:pimeloyl-ACP methyl ester carboxylesterase|nr:hypothetical protein [Actinomycetes bacterium]
MAAGGDPRGAAAGLDPVLFGDYQQLKRLLPSGSRMTLVQGAGHFLHLEKPEEVNGHILSWVTG